MEEFSRRVAEEFPRNAPEAVAPEAGAPETASRPAPPPAQPLQAHGLLWMVIKAKIAQLLVWLGLRRGKEEAR
jgi:hypothetical protein